MTRSESQGSLFEHSLGASDAEWEALETALQTPEFPRLDLMRLLYQWRLIDTALIREIGRTEQLKNAPAAVRRKMCVVIDRGFDLDALQASKLYFLEVVRRARTECEGSILLALRTPTRAA